MSERLASFFILSGSALVFVLVWYLSVVIVRRDLRRRQVRNIERRVWTIVTVALPLFGFALYLFIYLLRGYFTPEPPLPEGGSPQAAYPAEANVVFSSRAGAEPQKDRTFDAKDLAVLPATGATAGSAVVDEDVERTPSTVPVVHKPLNGNFALLVSQGPHTGLMFDLAPLPQRIGRGPEVTIPLDADLNVSRAHAEVYEWMGNLRVRDLGSVHGTLVNGVPVTDHAILPGDRLSVGGTMLILREIP